MDVKDPSLQGTFPQQLNRMQHASKLWLQSRGYIRLSLSDGEEVLEITDEGLRYFASLGK